MNGGTSIIRSESNPDLAWGGDSWVPILEAQIFRGLQHKPDLNTLMRRDWTLDSEDKMLPYLDNVESTNVQT